MTPEEAGQMLAKRKRGRPPKVVLVEQPVQPVTPVRPPKAFTVKQWKKNPMLQRMLDELLEQPTFQMAKQTIMMMAMPGAMPVSQLTPGISAEAMALADSNKYHHRSGMAQVFRALEGLARPEGEDLSSTAQWGKLVPEDE